MRPSCPGLSLVAAATFALACASAAKPPVRPPAAADSELTEGGSPTLAAEPRPPGVVVDPLTRLPPTRTTGSAARGLLTLTPPPDTRPALDVVDRFFRAVVQEQEDALAELFDPSGRMWAGSRRRQVSLLTAWSQRLARLDYGSLAGAMVYRARDREVYRATDVDKVSQGRELPMVPRGDEILVRVRISPIATQTNRLFGDEVVFLLRRTTSGYKIAQMKEDFRLP